MKIALLSTPFFGVNPTRSYGGAELVTYNLWKGLSDRGNKVVCFSPDPSTPPPKGHHFSTGPSSDTVNSDWMNLEKTMWSKCDPYFDDFDIILGSNWFGYEYQSKSRSHTINAAHVHHGHMASQWWNRGPPPFNLNLIAISRYMKNQYKSVNGYDSQVCYNGIDLGLYPYKIAKSDRFLFLGRISSIKGPHLALECAAKTGINLDVVGATSFIDDPKYVDRIDNMCTEVGAKFIGEVNQESKSSYLQNAKALLVCSQFGEPFGLMVVEALASGTPVIALRDGAIPEIVEHGKSGFICDNVNEMSEYIKRIDEIDPKACRNRAELFSLERMSERYEEVLKQVVDGFTW